MKVLICQTPSEANRAAADLLSGWLTDPGTRTVMVAAGNTPLDLYREIAGRSLNLSRLKVFALDEYVGVPLDEPRNCANLMRRCVAEAWGIPPNQFFTVSSLESDALESVRKHERLIAEAGGIDVIILGLGQNGHLGFNEPGSAENSTARVLDLSPISIEANRQWFDGKHAPSRGVTVGLKTILAARNAMILAFEAHKAQAVAEMIEGETGPACPASFLREHANAHAFLDRAAAELLTKK